MIIKAIKSLYSNVTYIKNDGEVCCDNDGNQVEIDETLIQAEVTRLQAEYDSKQYARDRAEAYPSIGDQLDMIFHAGLGGDEFQSAIQAVKDAHPKGGN